MDSVFLEGLEFYGFHGVNPEERTDGQRFLVDLRMDADLRVAGRTDDLDATINYSAVYKRVRTIVEGPPSQLIETVAERIAAAILDEFATSSVAVTVRKPDVTLSGSNALDAAGVTIRRERRPGSSSTDEDAN
jgi:dihydroneopterin aldolase